MNYFVEAIVIGIITMLLGTGLSVGSMYLQPDFTLDKIDFWFSMLVSNFLIGFILHILFQWFGLNKWYCENGDACKV